MKLEEQVCSLEPAKHLEKLGVKQESYFSYTEQEGCIGLEHWELRRAASGADIVCSAFTVAEIIEFIKPMTTHCLEIHECGIWWTEIPYEAQRQEGKTLADACAAMLIYLLENGLVKV